jgi:hypothetical protein
MEKFLTKILGVIKTIKAPIIVIIFILALVQVGYNAFIGGHDKRSLITTLIGLMVMAGLIFYAEQIVEWIKNFL